ncbi:unnamed protein product [Prorocentrum cordatum]|uniref:Ion transport domain-containing protein n=1 Tax=Prorocentrum cordatum TaxID=2364126 RepID=A0ABN9XCT2_9DINO|nr:unnamed protein product [Polarella glacialis]
MEEEEGVRMEQWQLRLELEASPRQGRGSPLMPVTVDQVLAGKGTSASWDSMAVPSFDKMPVYLSERTEQSSVEEDPSEPSRQGPEDTWRVCANEEEDGEADVATNVQRLLRGQRRLEQLLTRLVSGEGVHEEQAVTRSPTNGETVRAAVGRSGGTASAAPFEVPQVRDGWQGTDDDLRLACETERANFVVDDLTDDMTKDPGSSFLFPGTFRAVLSNPGPDKTCLVWSPSSRLRLFMDLLSVVVLAYDVLSLPYLLAFEMPQRGLIMQLSVVSVVFWTLDLAFRFRTGFWHQGRLEMRPRAIAHQYLRSAFAIDLSLVLLDLIAIALSYLADNQPGEMDVFRLWRIGKITRVMRCMSFLRLRSVADIMERVSQRSKILQATSMVIYDVVRIVFMILWLNHVIACMWVGIGKNASSDTGLSWLDLPLGGPEYEPYRSAGDPYLYSTAFHWALTQMTPGSMQVFPVNFTERVFNSVGLVFGVLVFSTLISSISSSVTQFKIGIASNTHQMDKLNRFLRKVDVNPSLAIQVRKQVRDKMKYQKPLVSKDVEALDLLPLSMQVSLQMELCRGHLELHPYFCFVMAVDVLTAEEYAFGGRRPRKTIRFLGNTPIEVARQPTAREPQLSELVEQGQWLAEAALWCDWRHAGTAEVGTAPSCEVLRVEADSLVRFMMVRKGAVGQSSWAYARSFHALLTEAANSPMHNRSSRPSDLRLPFYTEEVISNLPAGARAFVGNVALCELKASLGSVQSWVASLSEGWPNIERLREDLEGGNSSLVLSRGNKFGVQRVVTMVALHLCREDGRVLVALRRPNASQEGAEAKLPGLTQADGEYPEQCYQRLLDNYVGAMAPGIVLDGVERQYEETMEEDLGVSTRCIKIVFNARWEPPPAVMERVLSRRGSMDATGPLPTRDSQGDLLQTDEVFRLPGGAMVAWFTPEELQRISGADGTTALGQWLSRINFPLKASRRQRRDSKLREDELSGELREKDQDAESPAAL